MKSVLIITGFLMASASVYGVMEFKKKSGSREFREMYSEKKEIPPDAKDGKPQTIKTKVSKTIHPETKTVLLTNGNPVKELEKETTKVETSKYDESKKIKKAKRPVSIKEFSRAALVPPEKIKTKE